MIDSSNTVTSKVPHNFAQHNAVSNCFALIGSNPNPKYDSFHTFFHLTGIPQIFEYQFLKLIGRGSSATVYLVEDVNIHEKFAAKVYSKRFLFRPMLRGSRAIDQFQQEVAIMMMFTHPNILGLHEILDHDDSDSIILITSYCCFGSLLPPAFRCTPISETRSQKIFAQIVTALNQIHKEGIAHMDIKPENILIAENDLAVLSDFSTAHICRGNAGRIARSAGTPAFASPESFSQQPFDPQRADIWSLGVSLFVMLFGRHPFIMDLDDRAPIEARFMNLVNATHNGVLRFDGVESSTELQNLLTQLMDRNPAMRPTTEEILKHPWVKCAFNEEKRCVVPRLLSQEDECEEDIVSDVHLAE
jgi:serine/threonine protein kinase